MAIWDIFTKKKVNTLFPNGLPKDKVDSVVELGKMYRQLSELSGVEAERQKKAIQNKEESLKASGNMVTNNKAFGTDYYLSELGLNDLDYKNKQGNEINPAKDIRTVVKEAVQSAKAQDDEFKKQGELLSIREVSFVKDHSNYEKLKNYAYVLGLTPTTKGYQDPIKARLIQNGQGASDQVEITVAKWKTEDGRKIKDDPEVRTVSLKEFEENTDIKLNAAVRTDYTSKFGRSAAKIDLGTGIPKVALENSQVAILNQEVRESLPGMDEQRANQVKALLDDYIQGKFRFKAEVLEDNQPYYISVYKNGKFDAQVAFPGGTEKGGIKDFSYDDVVQVYRNSSDYATLAFQQYLYSIYPELRR
jgi:hypothetical protein